MSGPAVRRGLLLIAVVGPGLSGCLTDAPVPSEAPSASPEPAPTPTITRYALDTTAWYGGFVLTFGTVTAALDPKGGPVTVELGIANPGSDDATLDGPIVLTSGGRSLEPTRESVVPVAPAGETATATIAFEVDATFDVDAAAMQVGRPSEHQVVIPLVSPGDAVTLQPLAIELAGSRLAGTLFVELRGAELRADLPDWRQELERDRVALTLTYDATFRSSFLGGLPFTADSVSLRLPDGTIVSPRRDGHSQSILVLDPRTPAPGLRSRFEVPDPGLGEYVLVITDGSKSADLPFRIEAP